MPKIERDALPWSAATSYPEPYASDVRGRERKQLGDAVGLSQFGVNLLRIAPGAASSHRHWHAREDEFVMVLEGVVTLEEDDGATTLHTGDVAGFAAGHPVGHRLVNRSSAPALVLEIGTRSDADVSTYTDPEVDMQAVKENGAPWTMLRKDGRPYSR